MATYDRAKPGADLAGLQAELLAAGMPVQYLAGSGDLVRVVTSRDLTGPEVVTLDATVAAHDGDASRRAEVRAVAGALAADGSPRTVQLRALLRLIMGSIAETHGYLALLKAQVEALGGTLPPAPAVRTWDELVAAYQSLVAQGGGDPPPS